MSEQADQQAQPVAKVVMRHHETNARGGYGVDVKDVDLLDDSLPAGTPLFTSPPAQAEKDQRVIVAAEKLRQTIINNMAPLPFYIRVALAEYDKAKQP